MADLAYVLRHLPGNDDPNILAGSHPADDAAVYRISDELALVQTLDFFTPVVDDPYTYGLIAAANSLSDVYAMGATPLTALNIVAFPSKTLSPDVLGAILRGGADKAREAGVPIIGGHTVDDNEPKYGLSVTGTVHPDRLITAHGGRAGDLLVLTKPIGTGAIATALKAREVAGPHLTAAVRWMATLNRDASRAAVAAGVSAMTDVTGFGLLGHLSDLGRASGLAAVIRANAVPVLPGARAYIARGHVPGGTRTNLEALAGSTEFPAGGPEGLPELLADPQTSGGLLIALSRDSLAKFRTLAAPHVLAAVIGTLETGSPGRVRISVDLAERAGLETLTVPH